MCVFQRRKPPNVDSLKIFILTVHYIIEFFLRRNLATCDKFGVKNICDETYFLDTFKYQNWYFELIVELFLKWFRLSFMFSSFLFEHYHFSNAVSFNIIFISPIVEQQRRSARLLLNTTWKLLEILSSTDIFQKTYNSVFRF